MPPQSAPGAPRAPLTAAARIRGAALLVVGWVLVVAGIAALVLPGPGLLMVFSGLVILSQRYPWAEKRLRPIEIRAMRGAADSVQSWGRILVAAVFALGIGACGVLWIVGPPVASWWPLPAWLWLPGGNATGITLLVSCAVALSLLVWSYVKFHGKPEAVARIHEDAATN